MLKPGDKVYRVSTRIAHDGDDNQEPWEVESRTVVSASDKMIALKGCFAGIWRTRFSTKPASPLGRLFFATPAEAVVAFCNNQREAIAAYKRKITEATDALSWAIDWVTVERIADQAFAIVRDKEQDK